jgi:hypothetical protein
MEQSMKRYRAFLLSSIIVCASITTTVGQQGGPGQMPPMDPGVKTTFVHLGDHVPGLLYEPLTPGEKSKIGVFVMHYGGDYLQFPACTELSKRGYRVLCANNSNGNMQRILLDAKAGVTYLRKVPGITKVVLLGHSGGGTLMSAYQSIAENGVKACQGPEKLVKCTDRLAGMPAADGIMLIDSNFGNGAMAVFSLDPAVPDEQSGQPLNPALDLFNPANGFNPAGSTYSDAFLRKFQSAQGKRENQLIKAAQDRLAVIEAGKGHYADDEPFDVPGANSGQPGNKLFPEDIRLLSHTEKPWPLLHPDGSATTEIVHSVRLPELTKSNTPSLQGGAIRATVRAYLMENAIRVTSDYGLNESTVRGIDWTSTISSPPGNVESITVPLLTMGMTGHWEYIAAETIYEHAKSADKSIAFVAGGSHGYTTCKKCEKTPGEFGDTQKTTYDYVDKWLSKPGRFQ